MYFVILKDKKDGITCPWMDILKLAGTCGYTCSYRPKPAGYKVKSLDLSHNGSIKYKNVNISMIKMSRGLRRFMNRLSVS